MSGRFLMYSAIFGWPATFWWMADNLGKFLPKSGCLAIRADVTSKMARSAQVKALPTAKPFEPYAVTSFSTSPAPLAPCSCKNFLNASACYFLLFKKIKSESCEKISKKNSIYLYNYGYLFVGILNRINHTIIVVDELQKRVHNGIGLGL